MPHLTLAKTGINCVVVLITDVPHLPHLHSFRAGEKLRLAICAQVCENGSILEVVWNSGHISTYTSTWLHERSFSHHARSVKKSMLALKKVCVCTKKNREGNLRGHIYV